ncbi:hypothetical protein C8F01DRAFT_1375687, partial [Mycena amicta]
MSQDTKPSSHPLYTIFDTNLPLSRRLPALGTLSGTFGVASFTIGAIGGAIPRAVEAAVNSRRQTNPIPASRLIRLGALANGVRFGYRQSRGLPSSACIWLVPHRRPHTNPNSHSTLCRASPRWRPCSGSDVATAPAPRAPV